MTQPDAIILHDDDPDGLGGAYAAWEHYGQSALYVPVTDRLRAPAVVDEFPNANIYIIDFSYPMEEMVRLVRQRVGLVIVLDHHESFAKECSEAYEAAYRMDEYPNRLGAETLYGHFMAGTILSPIKVPVESGHFYYYGSVKKSGTTVAWTFFHPGRDVPKLLQHVEDYDLWKWELLGTDEIMTALQVYVRQEVDAGRSPFNLLHHYSRFSLSQMDERGLLEGLRGAGKAMKEYRDALVSDAVSNATLVEFPCEIDNDGEIVDRVSTMMAVTTSPRLISGIGGRLLDAHPDLPFVVICQPYVTAGLAVYSLRSRPDGFDCGAFARQMQEAQEATSGGGHRCAGAFQIPMERDHGLSGELPTLEAYFPAPCAAPTEID